MTQSEAETAAQTQASVVTGLGYPNGRLEDSPTPTGWFGSSEAEITNVSRETLPEKHD